MELQITDSPDCGVKGIAFEYELNMEKVDDTKTYVMYIDGVAVRRYPSILPEEYYNNIQTEFLKLSIQISFSKIIKKYC